MDDFSFEAGENSFKRAEKKVNELRERAKRRAREEESDKPVILLEKLFTIEEESKQ